MYIVSVLGLSTNASPAAEKLSVSTIATGIGSPGTQVSFRVELLASVEEEGREEAEVVLTAPEEAVEDAMTEPSEFRLRVVIAIGMNGFAWPRKTTMDTAASSTVMINTTTVTLLPIAAL